MRYYYVSVPSFAGHYASDGRYVIALEAGEQIAGVYRGGHRSVIVVAPRGTYHNTCGDMPHYYPAGEGGRVLRVFDWTHAGTCQYAAGEAPGQDGVLFSQDGRAAGPLICRTRRVLTPSDRHPFDSEWEWSRAPLEDLDPALTAREVALASIFPQFED